MRHDPATPPGLEKRRQPGRLRSIVLAVLVHVAFFALIVFGITWQNPPTAPVQADLWSKLPPAKAAPRASPPPEPKPAPKAEPKPEPPPVKPPEPKPEEVKPPKPDPAIAEKAAREKAEREKREKAEQDKRERLEKQKKEEDARRKREQEEAAKKKREEEKRRQEEEQAKAAAEQVRAAAAAARQSEIDSFVNKIKAKIRSRANIPDTVTGKPEVQVRIRVLPGGEVLDISIVKSSGNRVYDTAIERAIRSAQPLPVPPPNSELFPQFRDLILNIEHDR